VGSLASGEPRPLDPGAVLRADRRVALLPPLVALAVSGLALLVIAVLGRGSEYLVAGGLIAACLVVMTSVLSLGLSAWGRLALARPVLASAGHLPLRVMTFLDDAYERGVLRRAGPSYQFRHARLQDALASSAGDPEPHRSAK
jgi:hypothetical protein